MAIMIRVECAVCSGVLQSTINKCATSEDMVIEVEPCEQCLETSNEDGKEKGIEEEQRKVGT